MGKSGGGTVETSSDIPERYRDFVDGNLALAEQIANRPYHQYTGQRVAGFTPDQQAAFQQVRNLPGQYQGNLNNANAAFTAAMGSAVDPSTMISRYMNPYEDGVVQNAIGDINRQHQQIQNQGAAAAAGAGAFGGSRHGLLEAENNRNFMDRVGSVSGQLRQAGFTNAAQLGQGATNQMLQAGQSAQGLAGTQAGLGLQSANALAGVGQQQQGMNQAGLDINYGDFLDQMNYPISALSLRQSAIGQTPMGSIGQQPRQSDGTGAAALGALGTIGAAAITACWVAREVYGADNPKWLDFRRALLAKGSDKLLLRYLVKGPAVAEKLRTNPARKAEYRAIMDQVLEAA
jgi:hypothetical protein